MLKITSLDDWRTWNCFERRCRMLTVHSRFHNFHPYPSDLLHGHCGTRVDSRPAPSQWETSLKSNAVSHRLGANLQSALGIDTITPGSVGNEKQPWSASIHPVECDIKLLIYLKTSRHTRLNYGNGWIMPSLILWLMQSFIHRKNKGNPS